MFDNSRVATQCKRLQCLVLQGFMIDSCSYDLWGYFALSFPLDNFGQFFFMRSNVQEGSEWEKNYIVIQNWVSLEWKLGISCLFDFCITTKSKPINKCHHNDKQVNVKVNYRVQWWKMRGSEPFFYFAQNVLLCYAQISPIMQFKKGKQSKGQGQRQYIMSNW